MVNESKTLLEQVARMSHETSDPNYFWQQLAMFVGAVSLAALIVFLSECVKR